jgi:hypothetical protein
MVRSRVGFQEGPRCVWSVDVELEDDDVARVFAAMAEGFSTRIETGARVLVGQQGADEGFRIGSREGVAVSDAIVVDAHAAVVAG